jgi:hypothetical protein
MNPGPIKFDLSLGPSLSVSDLGQSIWNRTTKLRNFVSFGFFISFYDTFYDDYDSILIF